jgi:hypothetical protein
MKDRNSIEIISKNIIFYKVCFTTSEQVFIRKMQDLGHDIKADYFDDKYGVTKQLGLNAYVYIEDFDNSKVIVHEIVHVAWFFLNHLSIDVDENAEILAYLVEDIYKNYLEALHESKKRSRRKKRSKKDTQ